MIYLIIKMLLPLSIMLLIGCWLGWQLRSMEFTHKLRSLQDEWAGRFRAADQDRDIALKKATTLELKSKQVNKQLEITGRLIKNLEEAQADAQITLESNFEQIKTLSGTVDQLNAEVHKRELKLEKFTVLLKTLQKLEREQNTKVRSGASTIERLKLQAEEKAQQLDALNKELNSSESLQKSTKESSSDIKQQYHELQATLRDRETRLELIKQELDTQKKTAASMEKELQVIQTQVTTAPANDLSLSLEKSNRPVWILEKPDGTPDELQKITGIGPVMQRLLNEIGIYHYNQLARMNETDCLWIADRIKKFPKRIKRDRWQQQAVELDLDRIEQQELLPAPKKTTLDLSGEEE